MRRRVPLAICFTAGIAMLVQYFVPSLTFIYKEALDWTRVILAFALILGILSLVNVHTMRIKRKVGTWRYSYITLIGLGFMILSGLLNFYGAFEGAQPGSFVYVLSKVFDFDSLFLQVQIPIQGTMFSLLAFYIASAAFRAFRARTFEATLLLIAATIVMLGRVPVGDFIPGVPEITKWILDIPNTATKRGIVIGVGLGMTSTAIKIVLGIERTYLGGKD